MNKAPLWTKHQVAVRLDLSPETVTRMARRGELPCRMVAGRYRFDPDEIRAWLEQQRVSTVPEEKR